MSDYKAALLELVNKNPRYILFTDNFMGKMKTFATTQVNMPGRRMKYWIFELKEIMDFFEERNFNLVYKSVNYQPCHNFDNFPESYRINNSCNLLFERKHND